MGQRPSAGERERHPWWERGVLESAEKEGVTVQDRSQLEEVRLTKADHRRQTRGALPDQRDRPESRPMADAGAWDVGWRAGGRIDGAGRPELR
jgi:hypothetical protein